MNIPIFADEGTPPEDTPVVAPNSDNIYVLGGIHPPDEVVSRAAFVYETLTNTLVYAKNPDTRIYPASVTKIMTALVVLDNVRNLDTLVEYPSVLNDEFWTTNPNLRDPSLAGFSTRQSNLSVREVLYGLMLPSGCEAANILANHVGEGETELDRVADFIRKMNETAARLEMKNTNFTNSHGLFEEDNYSTVRDLFLVTQHAFAKHSVVFESIVSAREYTWPPNTDNPRGYTLPNTNRLIQRDNIYSYAPAFGVKTGGLPYIRRQETDGSWGPQLPGLANLVSIAERDSFRYIIVTAEAPWLAQSERKEGEAALHHAFNDHISLYEWAFTGFEYTVVQRQTDPVSSVKVLGGEASSVTLYPQMQMETEFYALLPKGLDVNSVVERIVRRDAEEIFAPVAGGAILGELELRIANQTLRIFPLITNTSVEKTQTEVVRSWFRDTFFDEVPPATDPETGGVLDPDAPPAYRLKTGYLLGLIGTAVLSVALIVLNYIRRHRRKQAEALRRKKPPHNKKIRL
ncbi:MAG: hypothetical protein FWD35_00210 [Oscillospiraceae bacterium]|nr:hypothetical protein [Oscillospiraceae bacterium]